MEFHVGKFVCSRATYCSGLSDMYAGKNIKLRQYVNLLGLRRSAIPYSETVLSPLRFNINCMYAAGGSAFTTSSFFIRCSLLIVNRIMTSGASG